MAVNVNELKEHARRIKAQLDLERDPINRLRLQGALEDIDYTLQHPEEYGGIVEGSDT